MWKGQGNHVVLRYRNLCRKKECKGYLEVHKHELCCRFSHIVQLTHPPTDYELSGCKNILLSDQFYWRPSKNLCEISTMGDGYRTSSNFHCCNNIVESRIPSDPPKIQYIEGLGIDYLDRAIKNISISLSQYLMAYMGITRSTLPQNIGNLPLPFFW